MSVHPEAVGQLLITGASGFTGKHLVCAAKAHGFDVVSLTSDVRDVDALKAEIAPTKPTYVIHLAGISNTQCQDVDMLQQVNVNGTRNLLQALVDTGKTPQRVLLASSVLVYGTSPVSPVTEDHALVPFNPYAASKIDMEAVAAEYRARLPICVVRPFNYSGVGQPTTFLISKVVDHFANKRDTIELGNIHVQREFNDVRYVCEVYIRLLSTDRCDSVINVCCGQPYTIEHVLQTLEKLTGHKIQVKVNPNFVRANDILFLYGSTKRLKAAIGSHICGKEALRDMLQWMVEDNEEGSKRSLREINYQC